MVFFAKLLYLLFGNLNLGSFYHRLTSLIQEFLLPKSFSLITIRIFLIIVTSFLLYSRNPNPQSHSPISRQRINNKVSGLDGLLFI
jgi:hypothetical protein